MCLAIKSCLMLAKGSGCLPVRECVSMLASFLSCRAKKGGRKKVIHINFLVPKWYTVNTCLHWKFLNILKTCPSRHRKSIFTSFSPSLNTSFLPKKNEGVKNIFRVFFSYKKIYKKEIFTYQILKTHLEHLSQHSRTFCF